MAAITPKAGGPWSSGLVALQSGATGTTTDWIDVPKWCNLIVVHLNITAGGTNTIQTLKSAHPTVRDDGTAITFFTSATITAAGYHSYTIHPWATSVADAAGAATAAVVPGTIPNLIGVTTTPTGSTYSTAIEFKKV